MNRAPGPNDNWWAQHEATCGGKFIKVKEPEDSKKKKSDSKPKVSGKLQVLMIHSFLGHFSNNTLY